MTSAYDNLKKRFADIDQLAGIKGILGKDAQTFMAPGSAPDRAAQMQTLADLIHKLSTEPEVGKWLAEAANDKGLPTDDKRNLFLMKREWTESSALTPQMALDLARLDTEGEELHRKWKPTGDWSKMKDWYKWAFEVRKGTGKAKMAAMPGQFASVYEALLDSFSPGLKEATVEREFAKLEQALPGLIRAAQEKQKAEATPLPLSGVFPLEQQALLCDRLLKAVGFDFNRGRFDLCAAHPSSGGTADDARITAQFDEKNPLPAIYAAIHEAGHAMYDQNRPLAWRHQPIGSHLGMGIHESQSRVMEVQACRTPQFFQFLEKEMRAAFKRPDDRALDADNLRRLVNRVNPSFIRIHADEMTYPAHVILRYRIEKAMTEGAMTIEQLPQAWNDSLQKLLGITPPDPSKGHMQDVHWPTGAVGYFPAYTIGDMTAAQFFAAAVRAHPEIPACIAKGDFTLLNDWLNQNVRGKAASLTPEELLRAATGEDLNADHYLNHLSLRYCGKPV